MGCAHGKDPNFQPPIQAPAAQKLLQPNIIRIELGHEPEDEPRGEHYLCNDSPVSRPISQASHKLGEASALPATREY